MGFRIEQRHFALRKKGSEFVGPTWASNALCLKKHPALKKNPEFVWLIWASNSRCLKDTLRSEKKSRVCWVYLGIECSASEEVKVEEQKNQLRVSSRAAGSRADEKKVVERGDECQICVAATCSSWIAFV